MTPHKVVCDKNYAIDCGPRIIGERERDGFLGILSRKDKS